MQGRGPRSRIRGTNHGIYLQGRGSRIRGANPGIRARVNYRASADDYSSTMESSAHHDHSNKRGKRFEGCGPSSVHNAPRLP